MCSVHQSRPFACRVFFCQEGSDDWQSEQYETFQSTMKNLHEKLGLPYRYMEWRSGLADAQAHGL
jgi:Fe-S-cluster containining protein